MRAALACLSLLLAAGPALAADDLSGLSDEFDAAASLDGWTRFDKAYGWPDKIKALDVGVATPGALRLEPYHSAWVRDLNGPFLFKTVTGDFDVRARVRVRGRDGGLPGGIWSIGGLMARTPNGLKADTWVPRRENWQFVNTGVAWEKGKPITETKATFNSFSSLKLKAYRSGWTELRLVRVGMTLFALVRPDADSPWEIRDRYYRMEPNPHMQVGLVAYTTSDDRPQEPENPEVQNRTVERDLKVDMVLEADWVRFSRPKVRSKPDFYDQVTDNRLAEPGLSDAEILALLGD
jgi:hypothetical protein